MFFTRACYALASFHGPFFIMIRKTDNVTAPPTEVIIRIGSIDTGSVWPQVVGSDDSICQGQVDIMRALSFISVRYGSSVRFALTWSVWSIRSKWSVWVNPLTWFVQLVRGADLSFRGRILTNSLAGLHAIFTLSKIGLDFRSGPQNSQRQRKSNRKPD